MRVIAYVLWVALMPTPPAQDHIILIGDSTAAPDGHIPLHSSGGLDGYDWNNAASAWVNLKTNSQQCFTPDLAYQWNSNRGRTLGIINAAQSGTHLGSPAVNGWGANTTSLLDGTQAQWIASGSPTILAVCCCLGANDVGADVLHASSVWATSIATINTRIKADYGSTVPLYFNILADDTPSGSDYRARMDAFRQGVLDAIAAGSCLLGANWTGQIYGDTTHPDTLPLGAEIGRAFYLGLNSGTPCPKLNSVTINSAKTLVTVTVDRSLGNSLSSSVGGFRVMDNGTAVTGLSGTVTAAGAMQFTWTSNGGVMAGTCTVSFASAEDAIGVTIPKGVTQTLADATTYQGPLVPFFAQTATVSDGHFGTIFTGVLR